MATPRSQRIGIWIIALILIISTLGLYLAMVLSMKNQKIDQAQLQKAYSEYQEKVDSQAKELSTKYYSDFSQYSSLPAPFEASEVSELIKTDLKVGDGAEITSSTPYSAYYIGWNPKGIVFDQSISDNSLKSPITGGGLIPGWEEGVIGMKIGGVRLLAIPSDKAYGEAGSGDDIPANTPIKFVVMAIPKVADVEIPQLLKDYYESQGV